MIRKAGFLFIFLLMLTAVRAQSILRPVDTAGTKAEAADTLSVMRQNQLQGDTTPAFADLSFSQRKFSGRQDFVDYLLTNNMLFSGVDQPETRLMEIRRPTTDRGVNKTMLFYLILGVCFLLALLRVGFKKYFKDLFRAFFSPTLSQRQLKDQLYQTPFPAFALNVFFAISAGVYLYLVLLKTQYLSVESPLYLVALFILLFMVIYVLKFIVLRIGGWLFGYRELMDNYIFTLFLINKILGIFLLPFSVTLAFSPAALSTVFFTSSIIFIALLFAYRYIRTFSFIKSQAAFSKFHFFLYLCGFEIAPVLIIAKLTLIWLNGA